MNVERISSKKVVVLVEPAGPMNIGLVARSCANFDVAELRLVAPRCNPTEPDALKMAVRGKSLLKKAAEFSTLIDAVADCRGVIATCGRIDHGEIPLEKPEEALPWLLSISGSDPIALVFGREDRGLTNDELLHAQKVITLHSSPEYPSLNLSHAVAVVLHEINRIQSKKNRFPDGYQSGNEPCLPVELDDCMDDAKRLLLDVGFLLEHTANARMTKLRGLLQRASIRSQEVALIRGMLRQIRWAINSHHS